MLLWCWELGERSVSNGNDPFTQVHLRELPTYFKFTRSRWRLIGSDPMRNTHDKTLTNFYIFMVKIFNYLPSTSWKTSKDLSSCFVNPKSMNFQTFFHSSWILLCWVPFPLWNLTLSMITFHLLRLLRTWRLRGHCIFWVLDEKLLKTNLNISMIASSSLSWELPNRALKRALISTFPWSNPIVKKSSSWNYVY